MPLDDNQTLILPREAVELIGLPLDQSHHFAKGRVSKVEGSHHTCWVKVGNDSRPRLKHRLVRKIWHLLPATALTKSNRSDDPDTLLKQAEQFKLLRDAGFNTGEVLYADRSFFITEDTGISLAELRIRLSNAVSEQKPPDARLFELLVLRATNELSRLHAAGLAHGRPKLRDFTWQTDEPTDGTSGKIYILDLEERPWEDMPMADAQARDVVLWIIDLCVDESIRSTAEKASEALFKGSSNQTQKSIRQILQAASKLATPLEFVVNAGLGGRELKGGLAAYALLTEQIAQMDAETRDVRND